MVGVTLLITTVALIVFICGIALGIDCIKNFKTDRSFYVVYIPISILMVIGGISLILMLFEL